MSLQLRSSTRIPSRSSSSFMLLAFLLLLTLPQQHLAEGEGAAPAWRRVPYTPQRAIAVSWSQERERTPPAPSYNLVSSAAAPSSARAATELRCVCLTLTPRINPKMIANLEVIPAGPQCPTVEVIAKLKNQKDVCLDPEAPLIKKIIQKILDSEKKKTKRNALAVEKSASIQ